MRGPYPPREALLPSYRPVKENAIARQTTIRAAHMPGIVAVVDRIIVAHERKLAAAARRRAEQALLEDRLEERLEYQQTSEPVIRASRRRG